MTNTNWEKIESGSKTDGSWPAKGQELKIGDSIEGRYIEKNSNVGPNKSNIYILEDGGKTIGAWGSTVIDGRMANVAIGKMVKIVYKGIQNSEKGGRKYKDFDVFQGIDVAGDEGKARGYGEQDEPEIGGHINDVGDGDVKDEENLPF